MEDTIKEPKRSSYVCSVLFTIYVILIIGSIVYGIYLSYLFRYPMLQQLQDYDYTPFSVFLLKCLIYAYMALEGIACGGTAGMLAPVLIPLYAIYSYA